MRRKICCRCVRVYICARSIRKIARGRCTAPCEQHRGTASWQLRPRVTLLFLCVTAWFAAHKGGLDASSRPAQVKTKALGTISSARLTMSPARRGGIGRGRWRFLPRKTLAKVKLPLSLFFLHPPPNPHAFGLRSGVRSVHQVGRIGCCAR